MKKLSFLFGILFFCGQVVFATENLAELTNTNNVVSDKATQVIEMTENKVILNIQKQPLNENSKQKIVLKKNWFVVNINVNGKVKVNPLANTYEVE